jgi:release factor glutamine methyltransferase
MNAPCGLRGLLMGFTRRLRESGVDSPRLSAEIILAHALGLERNELLKRLILTPDASVEETEKARAQAGVARRAAGEPAAYIVGGKEFYGRRFCVSPDTLVPRPETELLVDLALEEATRHPPGYSGVLADFGTGTGCLAVTLALALPRWRVIALDISAGALDMAAANNRRHGPRNLQLLQADFHFPPLAPACLDLLLANPPYVSESEYALLDREVRDFEPKTALVPAGGNGLACALGILAAAPRLLKTGGALFMEIGCAQGPALLAALERGVWHGAGVRKDLAGLDRVLSVRKHREQNPAPCEKTHSDRDGMFSI